MGTGALPWVYAIGMLILGFALILLEVFVIPGFNIFGILGFATVCGGVYIAYVKLGLGAAVVVGVLASVGTVALIWLLVRHRAWQRLVLVTETDRASGYDSAPTGGPGVGVWGSDDSTQAQWPRPVRRAARGRGDRRGLHRYRGPYRGVVGQRQPSRRAGPVGAGGG